MSQEDRDAKQAMIAVSGEMHCKHENGGSVTFWIEPYEGGHAVEVSHSEVDSDSKLYWVKDKQVHWVNPAAQMCSPTLMQAPAVVSESVVSALFDE
jgi:hypothetical protein